MLLSSGRAITAYTPAYGGIAEALMKMSFGEGLGFAVAEGITLEQLFGYRYGSFVLEMAEEMSEGLLLGETTAEKVFTYLGEKVDTEQLLQVYEGKLEPVYACNIRETGKMAAGKWGLCSKAEFPCKRQRSKAACVDSCVPGNEL